MRWRMSLIVKGDCRSIYAVDLLPSDKFLMSIQTIVHPSELSTTCSRLYEYVVSSTILGRDVKGDASL